MKMGCPMEGLVGRRGDPGGGPRDSSADWLIAVAWRVMCGMPRPYATESVGT